MRLDRPHTYSSDTVKLVATEFVEPHYGLCFWKCEFYLKEKLVQNKYFDYQNPFFGLEPNLENFIFCTENKIYSYIPIRGNGLVYEKETNVFHLIPSCNDPLNNSFKGNFFYEDKLIIVRFFEIFIIDLKKVQVHSLSFNDKNQSIKKVLAQTGMIIVTYFENINNKEETKSFYFNSMNFKNIEL